MGRPQLGLPRLRRMLGVLAGPAIVPNDTPSTRPLESRDDGEDRCLARDADSMFASKSWDIIRLLWPACEPNFFTCVVRPGAA